MRKLSHFGFLVFMAFSALSCGEDRRNTEELVDPWLRERTPVALKLEGQVGVANIMDNWRKDDAGDIRIRLATSLLDMSSVAVEVIDLKYGATASIQPGSKLDLSGGKATFVVTAANGEKRTYTVVYDEFEEPLVGSYVMDPRKVLDQAVAANPVVAEGGVDGNSIFVTPNDKNWKWVGGSTVLGYINDDTITFTMTDVDSETGETSGICEHLPGNDNMYTSFTFTNNSIEYDLTEMYQLIPNGTSKWHKDTKGMITFTDNDGILLGKCFRVGPTFSLIAVNTSGNRTLAGENYLFERDSEKSSPWSYGAAGDYYNDISRFIDNCRRVVWLVKKQ